MLLFGGDTFAKRRVLARATADGFDVLNIVAHGNKAANLLKRFAAEVATKAASLDDEASICPRVAILMRVGVELDFVDTNNFVFADDVADFGQQAARGSAVADFIVGNKAFFAHIIAGIACVFDEQTTLARNAIAAVTGEEHCTFARKHRADNEV